MLKSKSSAKLGDAKPPSFYAQRVLSSVLHGGESSKPVSKQGVNEWRYSDDSSPCVNH